MKGPAERELRHPGLLIGALVAVLAGCTTGELRWDEGTAPGHDEPADGAGNGARRGVQNQMGPAGGGATTGPSGVGGGGMSALECAQRGAGSTAGAPTWLAFPCETWPQITPAEAGFDAVAFERWKAKHDFAVGGYGGEEPNDYGVVLARGGYLVATWGNPNVLHQSASVGKAFTKYALQLALDEGLIDSIDDAVSKYWTGQGQLSATSKHMDQGHQANVTFRHLRDMRGGFAVSNGSSWRNNEAVPTWANWTGDPAHDNYAHRAPGNYHYSSGGMWRLSQALTAIWKRELKEVLDEKIFSKIGIEASRWNWLSGEHVHDTDLYPDQPGYADFVDPPYRIDSKQVLGGGGWVRMTPKDLARVALVSATGGFWRGERLVGEGFNHNGAGGSSMQGWRQDGAQDLYLAYGRVAALDRSGTSHPYHPVVGELTNMIVDDVVPPSMPAGSPGSPGPQLPRANALSLWLRADAGVIGDAQGRVRQWEDQSGAGHHAQQADTDRQPQWIAGTASRPAAVGFSGAQNLDGAVGALGAPVTIFAAIRMTSNREAQYVLSLGDRSNNGGWGRGNHVSMSREGNGYYAMWGYPQGEPGHLRKAAALPSNQPLLVTARYRNVSDTDNHALWVNRQSLDVRDYTLPAGETFANQGDYAIGRWMHPGYPWYLEGEVFELVIYRAELSNEERAEVEAYLSAKYEIP